jgi:hypothetical protein
MKRFVRASPFNVSYDHAEFRRDRPQLGSKNENTVRYLGVDVEDALTLVEGAEV